MKQKLLLTKSLRAALMLLAVVLTWGSARASHTINVMNNSAVSGGVYIYAWDQAGKPLTDPWPGTKLTATTTVQGVSWYTKTFTGATTVKFKINLGGDNPENSATAEITTMGTGGQYYYEYDPTKYPSGHQPFEKYDNVTDYYDLPAGVTYSASDNCVYFINTNQWSQPMLYIRMASGGGYGNQNTNYPGEAMTKVGTNSNGWDIYRWYGKYPEQSGNKVIVITEKDDDSKTSGNLAYSRNAMISGYNYATLATVSSERDGTVVYNTPTYFYDANMRTALTDALGVPSGPANSTDAKYAIAAKSVKVLDISNHSISNLGSTSAGNTNGINYFTELEELYAGNNNIKHGVLTNLTKLKVLDMHGNTGLKGFGNNTATASENPILNIPSAANDLIYVDLSNCALTYLTALKNKAPNVETLKIANNTSFADNDYSSFANLKYLDYSGCDATPATVVSNFTSAQKGKLEYLDLSNNNMSATGASPVLNGFTALKTFKFGSQAKWTNSLTLTGCTAIEDIDLTGNIKQSGLTITNCGLTDLSETLVGASTLAACTSLDVSNNSLTTLDGVEVFPALTALVAKNNAFTTLTYTGHSVPQKIELSNNTSMTSANLSGNAIQKAAFMGCTNLQTLDISKNQIESLCANWQDNISSYSNWTGTGKYLYVAGLSNLVTLDISGNNISTLGANASNGNNSLRGLTSLTTLNAANNAIYSISTPVSTEYSSLQPLTALENLDLSGNSKNSAGGLHLLRTNGLPLKNVNLQNNSNLDEITIYNGELTDINFGISTGISGLSKLAKLDVTGNKLVNVTVPRTPNTLLSIDMSNNALLQSVTANHDVDGSNSKLRYIEVDGCPLLTNFTMTGCDLYYATQANTLNATNNPALATLNLSDDAISSADITLNGYQNLTSVDLSDNTVWAHGLTITNCPALTTIDVENNPAMTKVEANNGGYSNSSYPLVKTTANMNLSLYFNQNNFSAIPTVTAGVKYLYLQENAFAQDLTLDGDAIALKGIALSNKSSGVSPIKTFTASVASPTLDEWRIDFTQTPPAIVRSNDAASDGSNMVLEAINLSGNNSLEEIHVNGFKAITKLASATDMTTDAGKGIYVKGLSSLKKLDISGNRIVLIGQDGSLSGLSGLEQLDASHNVIRTLANRTARGTSGNANYRAAYGNGKYTAATCPNIEDLTGLKRLNLSYNHLCDSIHLETNHALEWLDVSHNRFINDRTDAVDKGPLYYLDSQDGVIKQWKETAWMVRRDAFTGDANDTIGLRMLDLYRQTNLRYLNISETYIENTAKNRIYVANRQGPLTLTTSTQADHEGHTVGRWGVPRFVLINHCALLDTLICNYNGMKSLGIGSAPEPSSSSNGGQITGCPNLKYLEAKEMRGQDPAIMQGELRVSAGNPLMEHYDVSGSNFDYIGLASGATGEHLRYINVSGNYQSQNTYTDNGNGTWTTTSKVNGKYFTVHGNPYQLNLSALPVLDSLVSVNTPHLQVMSAHNMPEFNYMEITQDPANNDLRELYLHHNATMNDVIGLETLNHLEVYQINDSHFTGTLEMPTAATATLRDLRVSNEALSYAASRNNLTSVPLGSFNALKRVDVQNNPAIAALDINATSAATLAHLDFANCHLDNNGFTGSGVGVEDLTALEYLDCSNDDTNAPNGTAGNWLTDLNLTAADRLTTLKAANNELYKIAVSPSQTMDVLDFHNNHVNGIDLTGVTVTNYNCANNGRKVKANAQAMAGGKTLYYFQLDATAAGDTKGGNFVGAEQSAMYLHNGSRTLGSDGFDATKASFASTVTHTSSSGAPRLKNAATADDLDPSKIYGKIAVLEPTATSGDSRASYGYDEGNENLTTEFYLDWDANAAVVTAIDDINGNVGEVSLRPGVGGMEVVGPAGQTFGVYDMAGRLVQQVTTDQTGRATIDGLTPGIYVVAGEKAQVR